MAAEGTSALASRPCYTDLPLTLVSRPYRLPSTRAEGGLCFFPSGPRSECVARPARRGRPGHSAEPFLFRPEHWRGKGVTAKQPLRLRPHRPRPPSSCCVAQATPQPPFWPWLVQACAPLLPAPSKPGTAALARPPQETPLLRCLLWPSCCARGRCGPLWTLSCFLEMRGMSYFRMSQPQEVEGSSLYGSSCGLS